MFKQTASQKFWECAGTRLVKAGHYLKAKGTSVFLKKVIQIIWTALQYDVSGLLTRLMLDAMPLKHSLDILVLCFTAAMTMQRPTKHRQKNPPSMRHHQKGPLSRLTMLLSCYMKARSWQCWASVPPSLQCSDTLWITSFKSIQNKALCVLVSEDQLVILSHPPHRHWCQVLPFELTFSTTSCSLRDWPSLALPSYQQQIQLPV